MVTFKSRPRHNPLDPEAPNKFYAIPVYTGNMGLKELSDEVAEKSSLTRGDCYNVIQIFLSTMKKALDKGYIVKLDDLGSFRTTLSSTGAETAEELSSANIKKARIRFTPGDELKGMLVNMKFSKKNRISWHLPYFKYLLSILADPHYAFLSVMGVFCFVIQI